MSMSNLIFLIANSFETELILHPMLGFPNGASFVNLLEFYQYFSRHVISSSIVVVVVVVAFFFFFFFFWVLSAKRLLGLILF